MTAATATPAAIAAEAHAVLHAALNLDWPETGRKAIGNAALDLDEALDIYGILAGEVICWEAVYPHLSVTGDPHGEALAKAADEAGMAARCLVTAVAAVCGTAVADALAAAGSGVS